MFGAAPSYWFTWFPGSLLATFGVLAIIWKGIVAAVNMQRAGREILELSPIIKEVRAEFSPNGGGSMRDRVEALHDWQLQHARDDSISFRRIDSKLERMDAALERIEDKQ